MNPTFKPHRRRSVATTLILVAWFAVLGAAAANRQNLVDWWQLHNYQAPATIADLVSQDTMTDYSRKVFYVNQPAIQDKAVFSTGCPNNGGEQTIVLGCYHGGQGGIALLQVSDPRLEGVQQVTAAHEMLHAAYDRLSTAERKKVDTMLLDYYHNDLHDQRILDTIDAYKKSEPDDVVNEMHSIFGTEIAQLPPNLESYYKRFFRQRSQVAAFAAQYQSAFTSRRATITRYEAQLTSLKAEIETRQADLKAQRQAIDEQQARLVEQRDSNNIAAYNAGVPVYNNLVDSYNRDVQSTQNLIEQYNRLVVARNAVALEQNQLFQELSSDNAPIQQ